MARLYLITNSNKTYYSSPDITAVPWDNAVFDVGTTFSAASFSPNGNLLALGGSDRTAIYTTSSLELVQEVPIPPSATYSNAAAGVFFSPDSEILFVNNFTSGEGVRCYFINVASGDTTNTPVLHEAMIDCSATHHIFRYQVDGTGTVYVKVRNATSPYAEVDLGIPLNGLRSAALSNNYLAVIYYENQTTLGAAITIYDLALGEEKITGLPPEIQPEADPADGRWEHVAFSHDGRYLVGVWRSWVNSVYRLYIFDTTTWTLEHSAVLTSASGYGNRPIFVPGEYNFFLRRFFYFDWGTKTFSALPSISGNSQPAISYTDMITDYSITVRDVDSELAERSGILINANNLSVIRELDSDVNGAVAFKGIGTDSGGIAAIMFDDSPTAQRNDLLLRGFVPDE